MARVAELPRRKNVALHRAAEVVVRPVIVVSADPYNQSRSPLAGVIPLTRALVKHPLHVETLQELAKRINERKVYDLVS